MKISYLDMPLYRYRFNELSITQNKDRFILGCIEENYNWQKIVLFLSENYNYNLKFFQPELKNRINYIKESYLFNKNIRCDPELRNKLFSLYPDSNFYFNIPLRIVKLFYRTFVPEALRIKIRNR